MADINLKGMGVALITPFKDDESVDYDALSKLVDYQVQNGTDYLVVLGTTAETPTLTEEEKKKISDLIHAYYGLEVQDNLIFNKYNLIRNLVLMFLGFITLVLAFNIRNKAYNVIPEVMIIIGWILLWEVLYYFLFDNLKSNIKIKRYKKLARCKIKFETKKSN